jgi:predicted dehydrogenase
MSQKMRGAIVGYGFIAGQGHAPAYLERARLQGDVQIVAVADITPARQNLAHDRFPGARIYSDVNALLDAEADRLDFIDVCAPPALHAPIVHAALDRRLHVLCEKPLATSVEEARAMLAHAQKVGRVIFPCHNYKHAPVIRAVRDVLQSDRIGDVHLVTLQTFRHTHARGVGEWRPDWRRERRFAGGGIAMDHGSHTFYLAFEWMRSYPTAISARMRAQEGLDTEDDFQCSLVFPTGTASAHLSWNAGVRKVLYTLHGSRGAIRVEDDALEVATIDPATKNPSSARWQFERQTISSDWMDASHVGWFNSMFDRFQLAIRTQDFVSRDAEEAFLCVQLIQSAYVSARERCREIPLSTQIAKVAA